MTKEEYFKKLSSNFNEGLELMKKKNKDYSGVIDPFKNFKSSNVVGVPVERGILVRIMDKVCRISQLLDNQAEVKDEQIKDTLLDLQNYANILNTYIYFKNNDNSLRPPKSANRPESR